MSRKSGVRQASEVTARATNLNGAIGTIGATTTICPQQHRQPSAQQPSSESCEVCVENRQAGDAFASQARISVAARSRKRIATKLRTARCQATIVGPLIMPQQRCEGRGASQRGKLIPLSASEINIRCEVRRCKEPIVVRLRLYSRAGRISAPCRWRWFGRRLDAGLGAETPRLRAALGDEYPINNRRSVYRCIEFLPVRVLRIHRRSLGAGRHIAVLRQGV